MIDDIYNYNGSKEQFRFWQHLANAGLIEGTYTGAEGSVGNGYDAIIGTNIPKSRISNAGWSLISVNYAPGQPEIFAAIYEGALFYGTDNGVFYTSRPVLSSQEAWNIDTKIDDGMAYTGKVWAASRNTCTNSASAFDKSSAYLLTATGIVCSLVFIQ